MAADLSSSKAAAVLELSSADSHSHHHLVKCSASTDAAAKMPVIKLRLGNKKIKKKKTSVKPSLIYYHILY